jgi:hypothetical protein
MFGFLKKKEIIEKVEPTSAVEKLTNNEILSTLNNLQKELDRLKLAVTGGLEHEVTQDGRITKQALVDLKSRDSAIIKNDNEKIIEGVFDGQNMIGADGKQYDVPANYASKSKLVEGDILKLTINNLGAFVYKQIKPIDRERLVGVLEQDSQNNQYYAVYDNRKWRLLTASVSYFKGQPGDEVVFMIPADGGSRWAAVENIVPK